jgi:hypothetical protein
MAINNPYRRKVLGHGITTTYIKQGHTNIAKEKAYIYWKQILLECFSQKYILAHPLFEGKTVCEEWLDYSNFKKWYDLNYYEIPSQRMVLTNNLFNGKNFCPETSCFLPNEINSVFQIVCQKTSDVDLPIGITQRQYQAYGIEIPVYTVAIQGKYIGIYSDLNESLSVWQAAKQKQLDELIEKYKEKLPSKILNILENYKFLTAVRQTT